jgi:hypothetical protein
MHLLTMWVSIPSSTTNLGQSKLDTPDFTLVAQAVFADNLQFRVSVRPQMSEGDISDISIGKLVLSGQDM